MKKLLLLLLLPACTEKHTEKKLEKLTIVVEYPRLSDTIEFHVYSYSLYSQRGSNTLSSLNPYEKNDYKKWKTLIQTTAPIRIIKNK